MLHNLSPWQGTVVNNWNKNQQKCLTVVVKQSFEYDDNGNVFPMEASEDIVMADTMRADPATSSLIATNEAVAFKQGFELYGNITAYPPKEKQVKVIEITLSLTQGNNAILNKTLRVTGDRVWQQSLIGKVASDPKPLKPTPIIYEKTYGGIDPDNTKKVFDKNPAGIGFRVKQVKGSALPNIEYPQDILKHPKKSINPAGYGALPLFWQPRLALLPEVAQTALMAGDYPYQSPLPDNVFNCAPQDQQLDICFNSDLILSLKGGSPNKEYQYVTAIKLPYSPPLVALINGEDQVFIDLICDTLVIDTNANTFHLVWRKSIDKKSGKSIDKSSDNNKTKHNKYRITPYSQIVLQQAKASAPT